MQNIARRATSVGRRVCFSRSCLATFSSSPYAAAELSKHEVIVIGAGAAGMSVSAELLRLVSLKQRYLASFFECYHEAFKSVLHV